MTNQNHNNQTFVHEIYSKTLTFAAIINQNYSERMTANFNNKREALNFKRWSRKGYAVFQSLGKVIHIGVILMTYNLITAPVIAQESQGMSDYPEIDTLPEVEIATSEPTVVMGLSGVPQQSICFVQSAINDASELAQDFAGTDIRQRGINGVQGDVSIRGG
ncbi:MAG: hypothetical protein CSA94_01645, partial [Bacteroidetes bacterium]